MKRLISVVFALSVVLGCGGEPSEQTPDAGLAVGGGGGGGGGGGSVIRVKEITPTGDFRMIAPRFSPDGQRIAFLQSGDEDTIAVMNADGTGVETLATNGSYLTSFAWSADGTKLYYGGLDLHVISSSGGTPEKVIDAFASMQIDLDPSGTKIVYTVNGTQRMYLVDLSTSPLTQTSFSQPGQSPRFSPDGTRLAFHDGEKFKVMDLETYEVLEVADGAHFFASIDWFKDGQRLLIGTLDFIEVVDLSASPPTRRPLYETFAAYDLDLSPDETKIAYFNNGQDPLKVLSGF